MKGISIQLDSLVDLLKKNISNKELIQSKDNFDMVYQKITQQAFKTINVIIQNFTDDVALKLSYSSLLNQLKTFLSLKPDADDDQQEDYYNREFDQVQQFMNSRKPVMPDLDAGQRGDIYKFLYQAQNKSKDIEEFMGNVNKFNPKTNKKFQLTNHKWKKTLKHLPIITQDIQTQTDMNLQFLVTLQKKLPNLFSFPSLKSKTSNENDSINKQNPQQGIMDIEAQIQKIINEKMQQKVRDIEEKKVIEQKKLKQKQNQEKKKETDKKKKKPLQSNKRNSQQNLQRNSNQLSSPSFKPKSQFNNNKKLNLPNQNVQKNNLDSIIMEQPKKQDKILNSQITKANEVALMENKEKKSVQQIRKIQQFLPSFQTILQKLSLPENMIGISQEQVKTIYQLLTTQFSSKIINSSINNQNQCLNKADNFNFVSQEGVQKMDKKDVIQKKLTSQKQVNTQVSYFNQFQKQKVNGIKELNSRSKFFSKDSNISQIQYQKKFSESNNFTQTQKQQRLRKGFQKNQNQKHLQNSCSVQDSKKQKSGSLQSQLNQTQIRNQHDSFKQKNNLNSNAHLKNSLPQLLKPGYVEKLHKLQKNNSVDSLAKQGDLTDIYLKKINDIKQPNSPQNSKLFNKENYTLDMYKSKQFLSRNRASQHINLPSLNRRTIKPNISLHQQIDESRKNPYLKKIGKKNTIHHSTIDSLNLIQKDQESENQVNIRRSMTKNEVKDLKEEERIMNELSKISNEGSVRLNLKNIAMYINCVESIHLKRCGEKCIHLERFYGFLQRNNIPNRRELSMHKADMNSNVKI